LYKRQIKNFTRRWHTHTHTQNTHIPKGRDSLIDLNFISNPSLLCSCTVILHLLTLTIMVCIQSSIWDPLLVPLQANALGKFGVMLMPTFPKPATWYRIQTETLSFLIIMTIHGCNGRRNSWQTWKNVLFKIAKNSPKGKGRYKQARNRVVSQLRNAKRDYFR